MSLLSPQRDNKLKTTIVQSKVTKSPPSIAPRTTTATYGASKVVVPSYMRQSPTQNPEGKKAGQQKQQQKVKVQNTSIKDLQNKLGQLDSKLAGIRQPQKLQSPTSKKKQNSKVQTKKSSVQAVKKKPQVQSPTNNLYRKDLIRKTCPDVVKAFETSKMLVSPSDMLINPRMTADNVEKAKMTKVTSNNNLIDLGATRNSFKMNNPQLKRIQSNKHLKSNQHSQKNISSPNNQDNGKMRVTMSNKLLSKGPEKKGPIVSLFDSTKGELKTQPKYEETKNYTSTMGKVSHNFTGLQNTQLSMLKQKKKILDGGTSCSTIFPLNNKTGLPSSRNNVSVPVIAKKQFNKQLNQSQLKITDFQIIKPLGSGKFSQVFLAVHRKLGMLVAIKQISKQKVKKFNMVKQVTDQIKLHSSLNHPHIIKFYALLQDSQSLFLILEYVEGGSLFDQLAIKSKLSFKQTAVYLKDVISAIQYLHEKSIAHRDIKPQNILIGMNCVAKICDLGWSAVILTSRKTYCGTFDYVPPEILQKKDYDLSVDVWCLGVLTYQLLTGKVPYQGDKHTVVMSKINNVQIFYPQQSQQFPSEAKQYIQWLLQHNPQQRPKSKQLLQHKFFDITKQPTHLPAQQVVNNNHHNSIYYKQ